MLLQLSTETLLKRTTSRCPVCRASVPAEVLRVTQGRESKVFLKKSCPEHGASAACIASDARFYWLASGDPQNACCGGAACCASDEGRPGTLGRNAAGHGAAPFETLSTCLALIEIVNSCDLACPTCFADSPIGSIGPKLDAIPLPDLQRRIDGVIARKGPIEILQLSGGEPTLHPQFFELLAWTQAHPGIGYVLLNTNGVRIAKDAGFARQLEETFVQKRFQLYLQFDGPQQAGQRELRAADLRAIREKAIRRCQQMALPVTLAMTVTPANLPHVWETIEYGLQFPNVRGVAFQPMFLSGRTFVDSAKSSPPLNGARNGILKAPASRSTRPTSFSPPSDNRTANCASRISRRCPAAIPIAPPSATCSRPRAAYARSAISSTSRRCKVSCTTRSITRSKISRNAAARISRSRNCSTLSR